MLWIFLEKKKEKNQGGFISRSRCVTKHPNGRFDKNGPGSNLTQGWKVASFFDRKKSRPILKCSEPERFTTRKGMNFFEITPNLKGYLCPNRAQCPSLHSKE